MTQSLYRWLLPTLAILAAPADAHHSYAMFDMTRTVALEATIVQFKWQNPHSFIEADVKAPEGSERWNVEMTAPNNLVQEGWKRTTVKPGDHVTLYVHPLRGGDKGGSFAGVKLADGTVLGRMAAGRQG